MKFYINNEVVYECDSDIALEQQQLDFLDQMDRDMDKGIKIHGELIKSPDLEQRTTFVVMNFIKALQQDNDAVISASCAYLVNRDPALQEIHANDDANKINIELKKTDSL